MKRFLIWQYMLNKNLLHKKEFVILLCMIPVLVWGMKGLSHQESAMLTILLSTEDETDEVTKQIMESLLSEDSVIQYKEADKEQAYYEVLAGKADAAWIFREDFQERLLATFGKGKDDCAPVLVIVPEDNVALKLTSMKLYGHIFPRLAYLLCEEYLDNQVPGIETISTDELREYYEQSGKWGDVFHITYARRNGFSEKEEAVSKEISISGSYLTMPIRGMLLIFIVIAGLVTVMYYLQDKERGMFAWFPVHKGRVLLYSYLMAGIVDACMVSMVAIIAVNGSGFAVQNLVDVLIYLPMVAVFCEGVMLICVKKAYIAGCIPFLVVGMLGLCPIFWDFGFGFLLQYLFPPTYVLRDSLGIGDKLVYVAVFFTVTTLYRWLWGRIAESM